MDDKIHLGRNLQNDWVPLYFLPDTHLAERSTMNTPHKQLMKRSTVTTDNTHPVETV